MSARRRGRERHAIYLIPGFFGFANLGRLRYFVHVDQFLKERCAERGIEARVHVVHTHPTASLPARAALVLETLARTLGRGEVAHLIGHSTGGVDARLVRAPGVATRNKVCAAAGWAMQARTRSATLVSKEKLFIWNYRSKLNKVAQAVKNMPHFVDCRDDRERLFLAFDI